MLWIVMLFFAQAASSQTQVERGEALFLEAGKGCGSCHALKGKGTAVGPDLSGIGRLAPQAIAMAARSSVTQYVEVIKPKEGESFPGYTVSTEGKNVTVFDLSKNPPEKKVLTVGEFTKAGNDKWKHPPAEAKIGNEQLADIVAYIRYAASGSKKAVDPTEVQ
jgi:mono/diheme cytochrome c family protein